MLLELLSVQHVRFVSGSRPYLGRKGDDKTRILWYYTSSNNPWQFDSPVYPRRSRPALFPISVQISRKVVAVGPGKNNDKGEIIPLDVREGDRVLFGKYAGTEIKIDGVEHLIMREDDILGIVT